MPPPPWTLTSADLAVGVAGEDGSSILLSKDTFPVSGGGKGFLSVSVGKLVKFSVKLS